MEASIQKCEIYEIDTDSPFLSEELIAFCDDLHSSTFDLKRNGVSGFDIHCDNIGINKHGKYVLFNQKDKSLNEDYVIDVFNEVKKELKSQFSIDEPILKENVPVERILMNATSVIQTIDNIKRGKLSETDEPLECMYNKNGDLQLLDGYHRLTEKLLNNDEFVDVNIVLDERYGYSSPVYAIVEKDDALDIDTSFVYSGLESVVSIEELNDLFDDLHKNKESLNQDKENIDYYRNVINEANSIKMKASKNKL